MAGGSHFQVTGLGHRVSGPGAGPGAGSGNLPSVIRHRFSHLLRWQDLSIQPSTKSSIQSSLIDSAIRHLSSTQSSIRHRYVVTRSRPYPVRRSLEVEAVSGWRLGTQPRQRGQHAVLPLPKACTPPILDTPYSILSECPYPYPYSTSPSPSATPACPG